MKIMSDRYPSYDVLAKRDSPSWNDQTRRVIDARMAIDPDHHVFFNDKEWATLRAVCARIIPEPQDRPRRAPLAAMLDEKLKSGSDDGYRDARLPRQDDAWRRGLAGIEAEAQARHGVEFQKLDAACQDEILRDLHEDKPRSNGWDGMSARLFFQKRLLHDIVGAYYAQPVAWSEIGFGGPASPRGYVRLNYDRRDPWEASEARPGREDEARRENVRVR